MATTYDKASLVMIPSGVKEDKLYSIKPTDGSGDFTFSRNSDIQATRVNSSGLIEKAKENNLPYSNDFGNAAWAKSGITATSGQSGYDGSNDAWLITKDSGTFRVIYEVLSYSGVQTFSFYAKGTTAIRWRGGNNDYLYQFDLATGTATSAGVYSAIELGMEDVGGGWYRCYGAANFSARTSYEIYADWNDPTILSFYLQDAQLNHGLVAQDYVETTTTAVVEGLTADLPRLDYSGGASCPSLLLEPSRTNNIAQAEFQGSGSLWYPSTSWSVEQNTSDVVSPEGVYNAVKLTETATTGFHSGYYNAAIATSFTGNYTISCFAKYNGRFFVLSPKGASERTYFNLQTGVVAQNGTGDFVDADIEDYGNGWYRCWVTASFSSENVNFEHLLANAVGSLTYTGNGTDGVYMYGAQAEAGSYPTSYIPTYGTAANRGEDDARKTSIGSLLNATEGTLFVEYAQTLPVTNVIFQVSIGNNSDRVQIENQAGGKPLIVATSGGVTQAVKVNPTAIPLNEVRRVAFTYRNSEFKMFVNGEFTGAELTGVTPTSLTAAYIGSEAGTSYTGFKINQALYFKNALTEAEAIALTTI